MHLGTKVLFWKHWPVIDQDQKKLVDATISYQQEIQCDIIKIPMPGTWQAVCYGAKDDIWKGDDLGRRIISKPIIHDPKDWIKLPDFSKNEPDELIKMCTVTKAVKLTTNSEEVWATLFNPISIAIQLSGLKTFTEHCQIAPEMVRVGLGRILLNNIYCSDKFKNHGADGIYFVSQCMQQNLISSSIYTEFGKDADQTSLEACKNFTTTFFHIHGSTIDPVIGQVPENTLIHFENTSYNRSSIMSILNNKKNAIAGIPATDIRDTHGLESIKKYIANHKKCFPEMTIFSSGCVLPYNLPDKHIKKWIKAIKTTN